jgi:formate hydrogenlyase subunit 4
VDDPNTHLELTMIHEVMVLDHSGPDFAFILYGSAMKMWILGAILVQVVLPTTAVSSVTVRRFFMQPLTGPLLTNLAGMIGLAVLVGMVESVMARLRMVRVPQLLVAACAFSVLAIILVLRRS